MRLSTRVEYGVRAIIDLAVHNNQQPVPLREIAEREGISFQYLEQIFPSLRKNGIVDSIRGAKGGYILSRIPEKIKIGEVIRAIEGTILPVECLDEDHKGKCSCGHDGGCLTRMVWERLREQINETIDSITLQDIIDNDKVSRKGAK